MMEVFRDPSKRATLICDSSFSELSQYKFLDSQSKARPRQFTMSVSQSEKQLSCLCDLQKQDEKLTRSFNKNKLKAAFFKAKTLEDFENYLRIML